MVAPLDPENALSSPTPNNTTLELIRRTLDDLDPDGTIRKRSSRKGEAQTASPAVSHAPGAVPSHDRVIARARKYLSKLPGGIQGENGSKPTFNAARALVHGFALDANTALGLLLSEYNPKCEPQWSVQQLEHKVKDAEAKPFNKPRGWLLADDRDRPAPSRPTAPGPAAPVGHPGTTPAPDPFKPGLPSIVQQPAQFNDVVDQALAALVAANDPMTVFVHGASLVRIDTTASTAAVKNLSKAQLRLLLSQAARWMNESTTKEGEPLRKATFPKSEVIESIQDHTAWPGLPRLTAVADVPVITAESGILTKPGFDAASGVYLLPGGYAEVKPVSEAPSAHDVEVALSLLRDDLLGDFPFVDEASLANTVALFLLPFVRGLIDGPTPLHHVDAPQEGTGKSLLIETWGDVCLGRPPKAIGEIGRPEDWQKLILAAMMEAPREIFLDNLNKTLDSASLASAIASRTITGRLLGFSRMVSAPVNCAWVSTGNNVSMSRELVRRTVYIRLRRQAGHRVQRTEVQTQAAAVGAE